MRRASHRLRIRVIAVSAVVGLTVVAPRAPRAQETEAAAEAATSSDWLFPHPDGKSWISGQLNVIAQGHPGFTSPYSADHSLRGQTEGAVSFVGTLFTGFRLTPLTDAIVDLEMAAGDGISQAVGLGGFTNLDVVRNPTLSHEPYIARLMLHQVIPIGDAWVDVERGPLQLAPRVPARRVEISAGKLSTADFFDYNSAASDSRRQFLNWAVDNTGAYDYAADTRGYTYGVVAGYESPRFAAHFGVMLMPRVANGIQFDWNVAHSHAENLELELRYHLGGQAGQPGIVRALGYLNHASMGSYAEAIDTFENNRAADDACRAQLMATEGRDVSTGPVIECHRAQGRLKGGAAVNFEQKIVGTLLAFGRAGWNDGRNETFAYTEVDNTLVLGAAITGASWRRPGDRTGVAFVSNGLSHLHAEYLRQGGKGFLLGDGRLNYARETITEAYYTVDFGHGSAIAADVQVIANPGYNHDRGPVVVGAIRLHQDL